MAFDAEPCLILTTFDSLSQARDVIRVLVEARLIACGTILPGAESIYLWEGKIETGLECFCVMKTCRERVNSAMAEIKRLHSYEVPELLVLAPQDISPEYAKWLKSATL